MSGLDRVRVWLRRMRVMASLRSRERAMDDEMRHHLDCETAERIRAGASPAEARLAAVRVFGGIEKHKEDARDARGTRPLEDLIADVRYGVRVLRRNPAPTVAVVFTFGLGIAAASAIFSVVYGVLLRPLPYADPGRLVVVWERNIPRSVNQNVVSVPAFEAWRAANHAFTGMAALVPRSETLTLDGVPERVPGAEVSPGYFRLLGVPPALGRDFDTGDEHAGGSVPVILSHGFWMRAFGGDPGVIGRALPIAGTSSTIVGVMPRGFEPPRFGWLGAQDLWFPFVATSQNRGWGRFLLVVARLRADVAPERADAEMRTLAERLALELPSNKGWSTSVVPLAEQITGDVRTPLSVLLAAVALLLAIAIVNVGVLAATQARRRALELAIRRSVGATTGRLFRQLLTQHTLLAFGGALLGLLALKPAVALLISLAPIGLARLESIRVDAPVLAITIAVIALATIAFGALASAPRLPRVLPLAPGSHTTLDSPRGRRITALLVSAEIAVAIALSIVATLMARSFVTLRGVDPGFQTDGVIAARVALTGRAAASPRETFDTLTERVRAIPGVDSTAIMSARPLSGIGVATRVTDPSKPADSRSDEVVSDIRYVSTATFRTLRIPLLAGAALSENAAADRIEVVVSESLARAIWPGQRPIGRELRLVLYGGITATVVGIVGDVHLIDPRTPVRPAAYLSAARFPSDTRDLLVRVAGDPNAIVPALRSAVGEVAPGVPLYQVDLLTKRLDESLARERFTTIVLAAFAAIALTLGCIGVVGVVGTEIARTRKEIGIRMALGAARGAVVRMMLTSTLWRAASGIAAGVAVALILGQSMTSLLFGIAPNDPASYVAVVLAVLFLAVAATAIPVALATGRSPLGALREG